MAMVFWQHSAEREGYALIWDINEYGEHRRTAQIGCKNSDSEQLEEEEEQDCEMKTTVLNLIWGTLWLTCN